MLMLAVPADSGWNVVELVLWPPAIVNELLANVPTAEALSVRFTVMGNAPVRRTPKVLWLFRVVGSNSVKEALTLLLLE